MDLNLILGLIRLSAEAIDRLNGRPVIYDYDKSPEEKTFDDIMDKMLAVQRDNLATLQFLYDHGTKAKPTSEMLTEAKETLARYREENKLIK